MRSWIDRLRGAGKQAGKGADSQVESTPATWTPPREVSSDDATQMYTSSNAVLGCLIVDEGPESIRGQRFMIRNRETQIGRGADCEIPLRDPRVSRIHVTLVPEGAGLLLLHRSATNPTLVNGQLVAEKTTIFDGDRIQLGPDVLLRLEAPLLPKIASKPSGLPGVMEEQIELNERIEREYVRDGCFLDLDVVDSFGMKQQAAPERVVVSFERFRAFVEREIAANRGRVLNSSGDEVMAFFERPDDALAASRSLLTGLDEFNARENRLGRPFRARIGIDAGRCAVDLARGVAYSPILDTAGHLQKAAPINGALLSENTYRGLSQASPELEQTMAEGKQVVKAWCYRSPGSSAS